MTTPKPVRGLILILVLLLGGGCATQGPTHLYLAGPADVPVAQVVLPAGATGSYDARQVPGERVIGLGYEFNTDYVWLRLAPGNRLVALKRFEEAFWYDYALPDLFRLAEGESGDLAVRAFDRTVYAALAGGRVGKVSRYGEILRVQPLTESGRPIGGLAWDQVADELLVLWADGPEVTRFGRDWREGATVRLAGEVDPVSLAYDSNAAVFYVPLAGREELGAFDAAGAAVGRRPVAAGVSAIDAGQMSAVRVF